ncbi:DUF5694 domain-containing protein [Spirosoma sp. RP8]|uniref:DUF5694 domain-containing protein n=1 Tax=Spirosoma liriopis TaxID=2937440 RepID=A0ABT0HWS5_9BACT|nr:DUF5694 domain-containing protein [Spirosoma liriopis]MCK8495980.1 DUF5694 domain-containing protein [Spirosoma liriopis]
MLKYLFGFLFFLISLNVTAQSAASPKIKVLLVGSIHFTPSTQDAYQNKVVDVRDKERQKQLDQMLTQLSQFLPNQICIEVPTKGQSKVDSEYHQYLKGQFKPGTDEVDQIAYPLAKRLKLPTLTCVNYRGSFDLEPVNAYAKANGQTAILEALDQFASRTMTGVVDVQEKQSITDLYRFINSKEELRKNASIYTEFATRIGQGSNYPGTDLVANWYSTNLHIYTNILRAIRPGDRAIMVLFGYGHIPILKHLFESNTQFEVVDVSDVLKK